MRKIVSKNIRKDEYLLHADMFNTDKFPTKAITINCGLGESNLLNIAGGLSSQNETVWIYGVAGFIIHRLEQLKFSCKNFGAKAGKIIIFNAGKIGYDDFGIGHKLDDDKDICKMLDIIFFEPESLEDLNRNLEEIKKEKTGIFYIRLGKDY